MFGETEARTSELKTGKPTGDLPGASSPFAGNIRVDSAEARDEAIALSADQAKALIRGPCVDVHERRQEGRFFKKTVDVLKRQRLLMLVKPAS